MIIPRTSSIVSRTGKGKTVGVFVLVATRSWRLLTLAIWLADLRALGREMVYSIPLLQPPNWMPRDNLYNLEKSVTAAIVMPTR